MPKDFFNDVYEAKLNKKQSRYNKVEKHIFKEKDKSQVCTSLLLAT